MNRGRGVLRRFEHMLRELARFGTVGAVAFVINMVITNLLWLAWGTRGTLTANVLATIAAATFAYVANRHWTWRNREKIGLAREYFLFFVLNAVGLLIEILFIGFVKYTANVDNQLALNAAKLVGVGFGSLFRFWSYQKWVFLSADTPPDDGRLLLRPLRHEDPAVEDDAPLARNGSGPPAPGSNSQKGQT
ncbi:hypothetical protein GCM10017673_28760 [Streptosporangium violaceochromogenes]|nr:hypothetical protein GCM10017673_28760 [Streptosporangium violaceochromogenes]